ncbi:MAG: hypothetical protein RIR01_2398 [Bacteroidota bacterium]|jgi:ribosomal protein S16
MAKKIKLGLNVFDYGGLVKSKIKKTVSLLPKEEFITLDTHDSEYSITPKIRDAEPNPETGEIKSYYDPETGTIYLTPDDLENNNVIKSFEKQHYDLIGQKEKEKKIIDKIEQSKLKSFVPTPINDNVSLNFSTDSEINPDNTKSITGLNTSIDYNKNGFSIGADASLKNDVERNKLLFNLNNQRVGYDGSIGDVSFGFKANNSFESNNKPSFNPNTSAFVQKNNFTLEGNNSFQKQEDGSYSFSPNATLSYDDGNNSFSARHEFTKGEDGKWKITPTFSGNVKRGNWTLGQTVSPIRDEEFNTNTDINSSVRYTSPNEKFNAGLNTNYFRFNNQKPEFNNANFNASYRLPINKNLNLNVAGSNEFTKEDMLNPNLNLGVNYGGRNNPMSFNISNEFKEGSLFNPQVGFRYKLENGGTMNEQLMQQVQQMIQQGASKGDVAQQLMAAVQQGQLDQESVMQVFQELGITEQDLQQTQKPTEAQEQVMALGGMHKYPDGGQPSPEEMAMMQQQGQAPQQGGGDPMQQVMQMVQQMVQQGAQPVDVVKALLENQVPPEAIMQVLTQMGMPQEEAQGLIQEVMQGGQQQMQSQGEEQMEGAASNPQEEAQEIPQQAYGGYVREIMRKALGGNVTSDTDSGSVAAKRNLEFANVLKRNTHMSMLDNAFDAGVKDTGALPKAGWGDEMKALMEKYKDDPEFKKYSEYLQGATQAQDQMAMWSKMASNPNVMGMPFIPNNGVFGGPSLFSRLINNSGWKDGKWDFSNIPLSNDPDAKYRVKHGDIQKGLFKRKFSFDVDWDVPGAITTADPNKTTVDPNKTTVDPNLVTNPNAKTNSSNDVTFTNDDNTRGINKNGELVSFDYQPSRRQLRQEEKERQRGLDFERDQADNYVENLDGNDIKLKGPTDEINAKYNYLAYQGVPGQSNPYAGTYLDPSKEFEGDENIGRRDVKNYYKEAFPNLTRKERRQLTRETLNTGDLMTGVINRPKDASSSYDVFSPEERKEAKLDEAKRAEEIKKQVAKKNRETFDNKLDEGFDVIRKDLSEADKLKAKNEKFAALQGTSGNYKDYENIYQGTYIDPSERFKGDDDISRRDLKGYYREAFPSLSRRETRRLARESNETGKILNAGDLFGSDYTFRTPTPTTEQKTYGGEIDSQDLYNAAQKIVMAFGGNLPKAFVGQPMTDKKSGNGKVTYEDKFKIDWDAAGDSAIQGMDWLSSKLNNLDVQDRMNDSDRFSSVNSFKPQSYEDMSRGLYGPQGEFVPNDQGPTTIFNPTDAEGTFYRQLYALGGTITKDSFTQEELDILKEAGYNIDDLI